MDQWREERHRLQQYGSQRRPTTSAVLRTETYHKKRGIGVNYYKESFFTTSFYCLVTFGMWILGGVMGVYVGYLSIGLVLLLALVFL